MLKIILLTIVLVPGLSFARGHRMSEEAITALEGCGISRPERGHRPSRELRKEIRTCLTEAGIEVRARKRQGQRRNRSDQDNYSSESILE